MQHGVAEHNPYLIMEFVRGDEFCTTSCVHDGQLLLHTTAPSSAVQLEYVPVEQVEVQKWVQNFCASTKLTGSHSFDFMVSKGTAYAIECNPRLHTASVNFHEQGEQIVQAYSYKGADGMTKKPQFANPVRVRHTWWLYHKIADAFQAASFNDFCHICWELHEGRDAIWDPSDPVPFVLLPHLQMVMLLIESIRHRKAFAVFDLAVGKLHWQH
eukprot:gnl/TRDRNA2_/TRDRNA2_168203_c0_seq2.p1 gnl/TRDRNA2_/TRDRNA2_168203_c0~~gnl/TRDRNA2_/TRDRNA2_168203_c0_seq2.p1  ORF type:complete len:213 (+),score=31.21 gnl/TRDRNA2_/TRDRNA2_168203_c0_seq2:160-798(+)